MPVATTTIHTNMAAGAAVALKGVQEQKAFTAVVFVVDFGSIEAMPQAVQQCRDQIVNALALPRCIECKVCTTGALRQNPNYHVFKASLALAANRQPVVAENPYGGGEILRFVP